MEPVFNPDMVILARRSRGFTQTQLAKEMKVSQVVISKLEKGLLPPSKKLLPKLSKSLYYPKIFFYKEGKLYPSTTPFHRKRQAVIKRLREQNEAITNILTLQIRDLMYLDKEHPIIMDTNIKKYELDLYKNNPEKIAQDLRRHWNLPLTPIENLTEIIEDAGIIVKYLHFGSPLMDGFTVQTRYKPPAPPIIFLNKEFPGDRLRFTLAHELGHLVMHTVQSSKVEEQAHKFAAEFLMPAEEIKKDFRQVSIKSLAGLKKYWKVSMNALLKRASDLGAVNYNQSRYLWAKMAKAGYRKREPSELDIPVEEASLIYDILLTHHEEWGRSIEDLCKAIGIYRSDFIVWYSDDIPDPMKKIRIVREEES